LSDSNASREEDEMETPRPQEAGRMTYHNEVDRMIAVTAREGDAPVDGLLKLMEITTEYDGLDTWRG
jgi:hypothetical protein